MSNKGKPQGSQGDRPPRHPDDFETSKSTSPPDLVTNTIPPPKPKPKPKPPEGDE